MTVHTIDLLFQDTPGLIAAYLIEDQGQLALIETGPGSCHQALCEAITGLGFSPQDIRHILVTHIHLDHSGAAGWWAQQGAQIYCHPNAARHLIDPSRLIESSQMVYGEAMARLWGEILPAPQKRVTPLNDGDHIQVGQTKIVAWDTPGHARHHHAYVIGDACFTGDVAGLRLAHSDYLSVTAAPPQFDPPAYLHSVDRLLEASFKRLFLTHFGEVADVQDHLIRYKERIDAVHQNVQSWVKEGANEAEIRQHYHDAEWKLAQAAGLTKDDWHLHEMSNATAMCADGIRLYVDKNP